MKHENTKLLLRFQNTYFNIMEENANRLSLLSRKTNRLLKLKTLHIKTDKILLSPRQN